MVLGVAVRYRARDSLVEALPAFAVALMNLYILVYAIGLAS